ncbi:MAG: hypothetical protein HYX85_00205 [Chloroflexi bacterium]|nr:hypothetical protein [Chloroflexota bacterium]
MKRYGNVSLVDLPLSPYDIVIVYPKEYGEDIVRAQVKTAKRSVSFTGGSRGGVDRTYKSGVKTYTQSPSTCDVVIGLHPYNGSYDLYFVPTILVERLNQKSISLSKIGGLKNDYEMLDNCKNPEFVIAKAKAYGIIA